MGNGWLFVARQGTARSEPSEGGVQTDNYSSHYTWKTNTQTQTACLSVWGCTSKKVGPPPQAGCVTKAWELNSVPYTACIRRSNLDEASLNLAGLPSSYEKTLVMRDNRGRPKNHSTRKSRPFDPQLRHFFAPCSTHLLQV